MPKISGHIGELVMFNVQNAGTTTGVYFGQGLADYEIINDSFLNARVPDAASWGEVSFYKRNKKAIDMLKSMNNSCYEELLEEFKKRKNEINN